jgi:hypothetical protein
MLDKIKTQIIDYLKTNQIFQINIPCHVDSKMIDILGMTEDEFLMTNKDLHNLCKIIADKTIDEKLSILKSTLKDIGFSMKANMIDDTDIIDHYTFYRK